MKSILLKMLEMIKNTKTWMHLLITLIVLGLLAFFIFGDQKCETKKVRIESKGVKIK